MRYDVSKWAKEGAKVMHERKLERSKNHKQFCKRCEKSIPYEKRRNVFCSHSCAIMDHHPTYNKGKTHYCKKCNNKIIKTNKDFCDKKCEVMFKWNITKQKIEKGIINDPKILRKYLFEKHGKYCFICKRKTWLSKEISLALDHIDGHSENNHIINLRIICLNCHGQTPTYGSKNRGNGRDGLKKKLNENALLM